MLERAKDTPCPLCGAVPGPWNEPAAAADPSQAGPETEGLARRLADLESGRTTPEALRSHLLEMCAMCQEILMDVNDQDTKEVESRIAFRIAHLRRQAGA